MKKNLPYLILFIIIFLAQTPAEAQYILKEADQQFELFNYDKAIDLYEQAYKKKPTLHSAQRIAEAYSMQHDFQQAASWYAIAVQLPQSKTENIFNYAKSLQQNSQYSEAKTQYLVYFDKNKAISTDIKNSYLASCDSALTWMRNPKSVKINNRGDLNSTLSDWGSFSLQDATVFTSDRTTGNSESTGKKPFLKFDGSKLPNKRIYGWTGNAYLKLYVKHGNDSVQPFPIKTNTNYHMGPASFTADGNTMFFALTKIPEKINDQISTIRVETFSSTKGDDGKWTEPVAFLLNNSNQYSVGDPFITAIGNRLYFTSDMPGGLGGTDIYYIDKKNNGEWAIPVNLKEVNTTGNERNPFMDMDGNFYFSSDGRIGMGGLDIFLYAKNSTSVNQVQNMGYPLNSPQDDFAFNIDPKSGLAFLSSNRKGGLGSDDIYNVESQAIFAFKLTGTIYDQKTRQPIKNATVSLINSDRILKVETDQTGSFSFNLDGDSDYSLNAEKINYRSAVQSVTTKGLTSSSTLTKNLYLDSVELNKSIKLENIYYDFDKSNINEVAALELNKLVSILKDNPTMWIELGSHTDSRGKDAYNLALSQQRAQAAIAYIAAKGINKNRITAKGYGETQLLNKCANEKYCTETEHQLNRRTEFKIVKY